MHTQYIKTVIDMEEKYMYFKNIINFIIYFTSN